MSQAAGPVDWNQLYESLLKGAHERLTRLVVKVRQVLPKMRLLVRKATSNVHELEEQERGDDHAEVRTGDVRTSGEKRHYNHGLCRTQSYL